VIAGRHAVRRRGKIAHGLFIKVMRLFSITMSVGPIGGAPVPSITVAPRSTSRLKGPTPRSRVVAGTMTG